MSNIIQAQTYFGIRPVAAGRGPLRVGSETREHRGDGVSFAVHGNIKRRLADRVPHVATRTGIDKNLGVCQRATLGGYYI
jgi:hypothetical protein